MTPPRVVPVDPVDPAGPEQPASAEALRAAAEALRAGRLVAFPTETVYGLGANALDPRAVAGIYAAKGRPSTNPLIVHVRDSDHARTLVAAWPPLAQALAEAFWPGPLTLVLPKRGLVPDLVSAGLDTVGVRAPAHPVAQALLRAALLPLAAPSANRSQAISPTTAAHVARSLAHVDADALTILDGGTTRVGIESTVLDLSRGQPTVLRLGGVSTRALEAELARHPELGARLVHATNGSKDTEVARPSPGMDARHYAPAGQVLLAPLDTLRARLERDGDALPRPLGALTRGDVEALGAVDHHLRMPDDASDYASMLYAALHTLDELGCGSVLIEAVPDAPSWAAVADRLRRAATPRG
ncbi:Sua5/YciO/YrdC/YwlC [Plesiocystis pacifica SIR-1]|uniref:Threonylcarbamoyl-AMP synthase n=1 Tax=Plesiocystis pacifica SIR-1 TaxID=391625 RepID=A6GAJ0_9BACT|nr:L-threonylcarbamoyladenylate synthase [Plesiocystis pacifica]EDM77052.1 Sua5/YciO/YrdC/YwlC [Plesiocystis pacifica SIR-1]